MASAGATICAVHLPEQPETPPGMGLLAAHSGIRSEKIFSPPANTSFGIVPWGVGTELLKAGFQRMAPLEELEYQTPV